MAGGQGMYKYSFGGGSFRWSAVSIATLLCLSTLNCEGQRLLAHKDINNITWTSSTLVSVRKVNMRRIGRQKLVPK